MNMDTPFKIGQTYWLPRHNAERVTIPCPACKGTKVITITYGDEQVSVDCEACGLGFEGPKGTVTEYEFTPAAEEFTVARPVGLYGDRWSVKATDGRTADFEILCETEAAALAMSAAKCAEQHELNMQSRLHSRSRAKHASWTVRYHRKCIADLEQQIAWHTARINAGKVKKEKP
jgi:ribosomal protein S27E